MSPEIKTIASGGVNCHLIHAKGGFVLIDTGWSLGRKRLERELADAGCQPGSLRLVVLTHGDTDHAGNASHLREKYGARIAMHRDDAGMVERGDMAWGRQSVGTLGRIAFSLPFVRLGKRDRFTPDIYLEDGQQLAEYGLDARVVHIPGHSRGSIALLTRNGDLFCGDLLVGGERPTMGSIIDDRPAAQASIEKLRALSVGTVYPGHGHPFPMVLFTRGDGRA